MIMGVAKFERLFRVAAQLDVDKDDLKRLTEFVNRKLHDLMLMGVVAAKANGRDVIRLYDLPITKGLQETLREFKKMDVELELEPILDQLAGLPQVELEYDEEVRAHLPELVGAITVALARTFKILDGDLKNPQTEHWERAQRIFDQLL